MKFGSNKQNNEESHASKVTVLSLGFELSGDIIATNDIRADGVLRGNIFTDKKVVVGEQASITGDISADEITISGEVIGDLYINGETTIHATAKVSGNLLTNQIYIHKGAQLNSSIRTQSVENIKKEKEAIQPDVKKIIPDKVHPIKPSAPEIKEEPRINQPPPVKERIRRNEIESDVSVEPEIKDIPRSW